MIELFFIVFLFGVKHALDLDHIATIDYFSYLSSRDKKINTIFKYLNGFFFALGHCIMVGLLNICVIFFVNSFKDSKFYDISIGTLRICILSFMLIKLSQSFKSLTQDLNTVKSKRINKVFDRVQNLLSVKYGAASFVVGILFALEFDASSEIITFLVPNMHTNNNAMILLSAMLVFSIGMMSLDTANGLIMGKLYNNIMERAGEEQFTRFKKYRYKLIKGVLYFYAALFSFMLILSLAELISKFVKNNIFFERLSEIQLVILSPYFGFLCFVIMTVCYTVLYRSTFKKTYK